MSHGLTEMTVFSYPDERMIGYRFYRIEYCGFNEACATEGSIWLPPWVDPERIEDLLNEPNPTGRIVMPKEFR